jgi:signal transduction histidine kinase
MICTEFHVRRESSTGDSGMVHLTHTEFVAKAKVLIIDDEPANVRLLERILERAKCETYFSTTDSREALALFEAHQPDLVLTDWLMPHFDGDAVIEQIRSKIGPDDFVPIVVLTADVNLETKRRALKAGATDFLTKPFDPLEVLLRIDNLLRSRSSHLKIQEQNATLEQSVRDRTVELEKALTELKSTQHQVIQQERLAALGAMAGGIAHDFNNALCAISGYSELLLRDAEHGLTKEAAIPPLTTILTAAEDASKIVHRLREFYRPSESDERRLPIPLNKLVEQAIALTSPKWKTQTIAAGHEILVETNLGHIPIIAGNGAELREVLINLIFNSVDAMPEGGTISLETRVEGDKVVLQISDTGTGMTKEVQTRCLEPFFTTKGERGTGLGLAMVFGIIQRHSGTIDLKSAPGAGTTFTFRFPVSQLHATASSSETEEFSERILHVLVVDDQPILCQLLCEYLQNDLHTVESAAGGTEALQKFAEQDFDVVITDQVMAEMNGYELAAALKAQKPEVPIILVTGFVDDAAIEPKASDPVDLIVGKPLSRAALRSALARVTAS